MSGNMESKQELRDQTDENQHSAPLRKQFLGEDESALNKILSKMDAQFLEIKETLYFRKIRPADPGVDAVEQSSKSPSLSVSGAKMPIRIVPMPDKGSAKVAPASRIKPKRKVGDILGNMPLDMASVVKKRSRSHSAIVSFNKQRDMRPQPERISKMYDRQIEKIGLSFSEKKKLDPHKHKCCFLFRCGRNNALDQYSRETLKENLFPPMYYWLVMTGVIPTERLPWLLPLLWCLIIGGKNVYFVHKNLKVLMQDVTCHFLSDNCVSASHGLTRQGTYLLYDIFQVLTVVCNVFILAPLLQSRELRSLLKYVGHSRVRGSKTLAMIIVVTPIVLLALATAFMLYIFTISSPSFQPLYSFIIFVSTIHGIAAYSATFVFWLLYNAIENCYADFAVDVLESANAPLRLYTPGGNHEVALMNQLKRIVCLSKTLTEHSRLALVLPLACGLVVFFWMIVTDWPSGHRLYSLLGNLITKVILPAVLPALIALLTTQAGDMLDRLVMLSKFLNLAQFVQNNPIQWMLSQRTPFSFAMFARLAVGVSVLGVVGNVVQSATSTLESSPLWFPVHQEFGSCTDGQWSGLEQHVDCGNSMPHPGCPACDKKFSEYILIEGSRQCKDVTGYVNINSQRACEVAYATIARTHTNSSKLFRVPATVFLSEKPSANASLSDLRCGSSVGHAANGKTVVFPALMSQAVLDHSVSTLKKWRKDAKLGQILWKNKTGRFFSVGVLCMSKARICGDSNTKEWRETIECGSAPSTSNPSASNRSSWTVVSQPWSHRTSTNIITLEVTVKRPVSVRAQSDCAHVALDAAKSHPGGHVVLSPPCASGLACGMTARVRSQDCSGVSALVYVGNNPSKRYDVSVLCGSAEGVSITASPGAHVHVISESTSGSFEIDFCV